MSRSGYTDDYDDQWGLIRWRGAVKSAILGARGQAFLRELRDALDAMPEKELAAGLFEADGEFCTLGVIAKARGLDTSHIDPDDNECRDPVAQLLGIAPALAAEIMYENDETLVDHRWEWADRDGRMVQVRVPIEGVAARRWQYMRDWVEKHIVKDRSAS